MIKNKTSLVTILIASMAFICFSYGSAYAATAAPDFYTTNENNPNININDAANGLLQNDGDVNPLTVVMAGPTSANEVPITFESDGRFTYTPNAALITTLNALASGESFVDTFNYAMTDSAPSGTTGLVTITINGINDSPAADAGGAYTINEGEDLTLDASGSSDVDSTDTLSYAWDLDNDGSYDDATGSGPTVTWAALAGLGLATDGSANTIALQVSDGNGGVDTASTTLTVNNVAPVVTETGGDQTVNEGSEVTNSGTFSDVGTSDTVTITASIGAINQDTGSSGNWSWSYTPADGPSGPTVVTITATDSDGATGTDTFTLTVNNVAPVVTETGGDQTVDEGSEATNNGTFSDIGDDTITITASIGAINQDTGSSGDWSWSYTPADGPSVPTVVTITATDSDGATGTDTFTLTVNNVAPAVTAPADQTADEGTSKTFNLGTFTDAGSGDTHVGYVNWGDGGSTRYLGGVTSPDITSSATDSANTAHAYADNGTYTVQVWVNDNDGGSSSITFTVTVNNIAPTANDDTSTANEDGPAVAIDLTTNDTDPGSDDLEISSIDLLANGTLGSVSINADNDTVEYDPNGQFESLAIGETGEDKFDYEINDGDGGVATATVTVTITGVNDSPVGNDDAFATNEDTSFTTGNVLTNDSDPDGDTLSVLSINSTGTLGTIIDNGDGTFDYNPNGKFENLAVGETATDAFTYTVSDVNGGMDTATVTITINGANDAPTALDDSGTEFSTDEDEAAFVTGDVLTNDSDPDGTDVLSIDTADVTSTNGAAIISNGDGTFTYDATASATLNALAVGATVNDTFTYTVTDSNGGTDTATVTIAVTGVNDAPIAVDDAFATNEDTSFTTGNVLTNDSDPDGTDTLSVDAVDATSINGAAIISNGDGTFIYDATASSILNALAAGESVSDTFTYTVTDSNSSTDTATVTIVVSGVNDAPTAVDDSGAEYSTDEATSFSTGNVLTNDTDPDTSDTLSVSSFDVTSASGATITHNGDGTFTYNPNGQFENLASGQTATDTFNYIVSDGNGGTDTGTVTIEINGINDEPTLDDPPDVVIDEDPGAPQTVTLTGIDEGASGAENSQTLTISATSSHPTIIPHPTISYTEDSDTGTLSFTPESNTNTSASDPITITVTVQDNGGTANGGDNSIERTFTVTVNPVNDMPVFTVGSGQSVDEDAGAQAVSGFITDMDDGDPELAQALTFNVTNDNNALFSSQPAIDSSGQLTYTPADNANGVATVTVTLTDDTTAGGAALTTTGQTFTITVGNVNDMPVFTAGSDQTVLEDAGTQTIANWATGIDDGDPEVTQSLTFTVINDNNALFSSQPELDASGQLTYTPADNANGSASVTVSLTDDDTAGGAGSALTTSDQTFTINVTAVNDEPSFTAGSDQTVIQGASSQTVNGWATSISAGPADESGQTLTFTVTNDNNAIFTDQPALDSSGTLTFTPSDSTSGSATVTVYLSDDGGTDNGGDDTSNSQTFIIKVQGAPVISVNPTSISYEIDEGDSLASTSFTLTNSNTGGYEALNLNYSISNDSGGWMTCSGSGSLASGDSAAIAVQFDTASLMPDTYRAYITITDPNALNDPVKIYVRVGVVGEITIQLGGDTDDAEQDFDGDVHTGDETLDLGRTGTHSNDTEYVGIRFSNINIPPGSEIKAADIEFQAYNNTSGGASINIYGQYAGNADTFNRFDDFGISERTRTSNFISAWDPDAWTRLELYQTPDMKEIVQEIINHSAWSSGNAMAFIINGTGLRTAVSNDSDGYWVGRGGNRQFINATTEPTLTIRYLPGAFSIIDVDTTEYDLWVWEGDSLDSETFTIKNTGNGALMYTITDTNTDAIDWITVTPSTGGPLEKGDTPDEITVSFDTTGLTADDPYTEYTGTISITDAEAVNSPVQISVRLLVYTPKPQIEVDKNYVGTTTHEGFSAKNQKFTITNTGPAALNYLITTDKSWLSCSPSSASGTPLASDDSVEISIDLSQTASLAVGTYEANITVSDSTDSTVAPATIQVSITVEAIPLSTACGDVPVYTENLLSPAIMLLLDVSGSMAWDIDVQSESQQTPDLKDIVQEIVNRGNWLSGNSMAFIISGTGHRPAYSFDGSTNSAPVLHVQFNSGSEVEIELNSSTDDAEESQYGGINLNSGDLDLGTVSTYWESVKYNGIRFNNIEIPQGATIESAYIEFGVSGSDSSTASLIIRGNDVDNALTFEDSNQNISGRDLTTASVTWNSTTGLTAWTGPTQQPRIEVAQAALKELVTDKTISWGFGTWHSGFPSSDNYTKINVGCKYYSDTHRGYLDTAIDAARPGSGTPLMPALNAGLDYFEGDRNDLKYGEPFVGADCQPAFAIIITDGMGNTGPTTVENVGTSTQALEEYGINTVGIGFGLALEDTEQLYKLAEVSNDYGDNDDDDYLFSLHEEVDSVPQPFMAQSKEELLAALKSITAGIKAEVFHGSAPAPTTSVDYGDIVITAKFQPTDWSGDLVATQYDNDTGMLTDVLWTASEQLPSTIKAFTIDPTVTGLADNDDVIAYADTTLATDSDPVLCSKGLGDIIDSTPIIVEDPAYTYYFDNYLRGFKYVVDRDPLVYIGSNDGALHAFMLTDKEVDGSIETYGGEEVWRFYPKAVQDNLNKAQVEDHWDMCDEDSYCHRYFVDGSPIVGDIFNGSTWKTMLVCGLREGGEAYFALDVSYGKSFDYSEDGDTSKRTKYMWEFTDTELGQTWADPAIARVDNDSGGTSWAVFFGSGYVEDPLDSTVQANKEAYLFGIEADNMNPLWNVSGSSTNKIKMSSTELKDDALAPPMLADVDRDIISEAVYVGNLYGSMYRVRSIGKDMTPAVTKLFNFGDTNHNNPIRAKADYGYTNVANIIRICFGTGIYETTSDRYSQYQQYFFGLKEDFSADTTYTLSSTDLATFKAGYMTDDNTGITYRQIQDVDGGTSPSNSSMNSWVIKLDTDTVLGSERVISQPLVVAGIVFFTTFIPDEDVCEGNGKAHLFALDVETGLPPTEPVFDINGDGVVNYLDVVTVGGNTFVPAGLSLGSGQPSKPVLHKDTLFVTTTGGGLTSLKVKPLGLSDMTSWKEKNN